MIPTLSGPCAGGRLDEPYGRAGRCRAGRVRLARYRVVAAGDVEAAVPSATRAAGVLSALLGVGFGAAMVISLDRLARGRELPMTPFGFRAFEGGPFDRLPPAAFTSMGWLLVATCALDVLAGVWLWKGQPRGARLALASSPVSFALSLGFALPFLLIGVPIRAGLILVGRKRLG
jgi:hypothetical protein